MKSMVLPAPAPAETGPLRLREGEVPIPAADELLVRVEVCGVCRTDLHVVEGDLEPLRRKSFRFRANTTWPAVAFTAPWNALRPSR